MRIIRSIKIVQKCPRKGFGGRVCNTSGKNVWGLRPHKFVSLLSRNLGPQTPFSDKIVARFRCCLLFAAYLGMDNYKAAAPQTPGEPKSPSRRSPG